MKNVYTLLAWTMLTTIICYGDEFNAVVNDVVTAKVVSITITSGSAPSGTILVVRRDGNDVGTLTLRTASGICKVLTGEAQTGDRVYLAKKSTDPKAGPKVETAITIDQKESVASYSTADSITDTNQRTLLEAEGLLLTARHLYSQLPEDKQRPRAELYKQSSEMLKRLWAAKAVSVTRDAKERVALELISSGKTVLAQKVSRKRPGTARAIAPILPELAHRFPLNTFGQASLISTDLSLWQTPQFWGEEAIDPNFSGWSFDSDTLSLSKDSDALIRNDLILDDVEVSGEVLIKSGSSLLLILRNEVVVKFIHESADCGVALKAGYNNLQSITSKGKANLLERNRWYTFKATLQGDQLTVTLDGDKVLESGIRLTKADTVRLPSRGHFGFGTYHGEGRFKNVTIRALTPAGISTLPVFSQNREFIASGQKFPVLDDKQEFVSIYSSKIQSHRRIHHAVKDGVLSFSGSPFAQFSTKALAADNYHVKGKLRIMDEGNLWFRMNERLLFGLSAVKKAQEQEEGAHVYYIKYRIGNYLSYDNGFTGSALIPNEWYEWEIDYRHPAAVLKVNGQQVALASCPESGPVKAGWNHFGISAYNVKSELKEIEFQPLTRKQAQLPVGTDIGKLFSDATAMLAQFAANPTQDNGGLTLARQILQGHREPVVADSNEFQAVAETFRTTNNWPVYLKLLEENYQRFDEKSTARQAAEKTWRLARQKFDIVQETLEPGDLGLDNIIRLSKPSSPMARATGTGLWYYLAGSKSLQLLDPAKRELTRTVAFDNDVSRIADRGAYLLVFSGDKKTIWKVDPTNGTILDSIIIGNGEILDWAGAADTRTSFFSVNENAVNELKFAKYVIYSLDEVKMEMYNSGGFGQMLALDPFSRYLYSGISVQRGGPMSGFDPSPVRPKNEGMFLDHLMCFSITGKDLSLISDRAAPGRAGTRLEVAPSGRYVCYVPNKGFTSDSNKELLGEKVPAFRAARVTHTVNSFDCGGRPSLMTFNPIKPVAYIYNGSTIRSFRTTDFQPLCVYSAPTTSVTGSGTELTVSASGQYLYFAYKGTPGGIAVFETLEDNEATDRVAPASMLAKAKEHLKAQKNKEAESILARLAESVMFSAIGEDAATLLLTLRGAQPDEGKLFPPDKYDINTYSRRPPPTAIKTPGKPPAPAHRPELKKEHKELLDDLNSYRNLAKRYPSSWYLVCRDGLEKQPENLEILLLLADSSIDAERANAARGYAEQLLKESEKKGYYAIRAYSLLARISDKLPRKIHMLKQAETLDPRNPFLHQRLGEAFAKANLRMHSNYHLRMSLFLFPSQPQLRDQLASAGFDVPKPAANEREIGDLYRDLAPSAVLIRHPAGVGTGFFITRDGILLTNHHVVAGSSGALTINITEADGKKHTLPGQVIASDARLDIAILAVDLGPIRVEPMLLAPPELANTGMRTIAIGNPGMGSEVLTRTVTEGIISNVNQRVGGQYYIQTSAAVNPGNSGGPLLSRHGVVIGMVTLKASLDNVGFAIPASRLFKYLEDNLN